MTTRTKGSSLSIRNLGISLGLSGGVLAFVAYKTWEPGAFSSIGDSFSYLFAGLALLMVALRFLLGGMRLAQASHGHFDLRQGVKGQLAWDFFSSVTPSVIGGGPLAALFMSREAKISAGESTAIYLFLMFLDQIFFALTVPIILGAALLLPVFPETVGTVGTAAFAVYFLAMMTWLGIFGYSTVFRPELLERFLNRIFRLPFLKRFQSKVRNELASMRERSTVIRGETAKFFARAFLLTCCSWLVKHLLVVFVILTVVRPVDPVVTTLRSMAMTIGALIMPTPGGSGGVEALYALFFGPLMPKAMLAPTMLMWRLLGYYIYIALGAVLTLSYVKTTQNRDPGPNTGEPGIEQQVLTDAELDSLPQPENAADVSVDPASGRQSE
ncbi:MAG: flippase-like domain-containing protein [Rhodothermales bacterium]|nr:flippase-like domain-containing protein [Rhodothermales bacterium]